jgi:hypothetical protein
MGKATFGKECCNSKTYLQVFDQFLFRGEVFRMDCSVFMPLPRLALQIGVVGHRPRQADEKSGIVDGLRPVLAAIENAALSISTPYFGTLFSNETPLFRLVSALADGADRYAVEAAPSGWRLAAVLPLPREEYLQDFAADSSKEFKSLLEGAATVTELVAPAGADLRDVAVRAQQYRALGGFLARQSDVLVAVWDGKPAAGPGGTAEVVADALMNGTPVV